MFPSPSASQNLLSEASLKKITPSAVLSLVPLSIQDDSHETDAFSLNQYDQDNQLVDWRSKNSWSSSIDEVSSVELMETHVINSMAPFLLNSRLKGMLLNSKNKFKYIINVSSMEGKFSQPFKQPFHPHTNMSKASLNMMTRTISLQYFEDQILVNSVDTGWITDEHPQEGMKRNSKFVPPLDEIDGAARILDPVLK